MSKFRKTKYRPLTELTTLERMTIDEVRERAAHFANVASAASREAAFLQRAYKRLKRDEARAA